MSEATGTYYGAAGRGILHWRVGADMPASGYRIRASNPGERDAHLDGGSADRRPGNRGTRSPKGLGQNWYGVAALVLSATGLGAVLLIVIERVGG